MLTISSKLFSSWNENVIRYCHWKSNEHLEPGLDGDTDLDVLLLAADKNKAENIMRQIGLVQYYSQYGSRFRDVDDWIGNDTVTGKMIHVHLHYELVTGHKGLKEFRLPWKDRLMSTRIQDEKTNVFIAEPTIELLTLYTRIALKASANQLRSARNNIFSLSEDDNREIAYLKERADMKHLQELCSEYFNSIGDIIFELICHDNLSCNDFLNLNRFVTSVIKPYYDGEFKSKFREYYYAIALRVIKQLRYRFDCNIITRKIPSSRQGIVIAFLGQDGSGKSTVTEDIKKWLEWKTETRKFYLGSGDHYNSWRKKIRNKVSGNSNPVLRFVSAILLLNDFIALAKQSKKKIARAHRYAQKGGVAIFDRFPQTVYLGINDGPKIREAYLPKVSNHILRKIVIHYAEKEERILESALRYQPDIVFKLVLPPEESIKRKPEENYEAVKRKHEIIKALVFPKSKIHIIDATINYKREIADIKAKIWEEIH